MFTLDICSWVLSAWPGFERMAVGCRLKKYLVTNQVCYDFIVTFDCAYVYFRYLFEGFERMVVGI